MDFEDFDEDSEICFCSCGNAFDLHDGNPCLRCNTIFCEECVDEPFDVCPGCRD